MSTKILPVGTEIPRRARGRPRGFDPEVALDKARRVFLEKGFSATSLDDLATATGLNRPSLYAAFGDKERLYIRALRKHATQLQVGLEAILAQDLPIADRLAQAYKAAIGLYTAPPAAPGCMIVGTASAESPTRPEIKAAARELLTGFERAFERAFIRAVKEGELAKSPSPLVRARMAMALLQMLSVRARLGETVAELKPVAPSIIPMICAAGK